MRIFLIAALATALAACGGAAQNGQAAGDTGNAATALDGNRIAALPEVQRNAVFIRALLNAGLDCQHVESSTSLGTVQGYPAWRATCRGGGQWTIVVTPDGTAQIVAGSAIPDGQNAAAAARNDAAVPE